MKHRPSIFAMILFGSLGLLFTAGSFYFIYTDLSRGSTDLVPSWVGAKLFFEEGISPYDDRVGVESQQIKYGRPAEEGEDEFLFVYPFYTIFYIGPLVLVSYKLAASVMMQIMLFSLLVGMGLSLHIMKWLPSPVMLAFLLLFTIISYFSIRGLLLAQWAIIGYLGHIIALWAIFKKYDYAAGLALALSTIKPQTGYLIVPFLLLWAWRNHRYRVLMAFGVFWGLLVGLSFILEPSWFANWIDKIRQYSGYTETVATAQIVTHFIGGVPTAIENAAQGILILLLAIPVLLFWKRILIDRDQSDFLWGTLLTMTFSLLVAPRTATTYYVELYPVVYVTLFILLKYWSRWKIFFAIVIVIVGNWAIFLATAPSKEEAGKEAAIVYVVFPVLIWALLMLYRKDWRVIQIS